MNSFVLRLSIPFIIVLLALLAFKSGVVVAYQPDLNKQPVGILIFHIISFFTFGAKDYGPPVAGPIFWQYVLYVVYYAAPLNFLSILAEAIYLLSKPLLPLLLYKKKYYLVIGYGRVGKAASDFIRVKAPNCRIVVLDKNENEIPSGLNLFRWKYLFLKRDMNELNPLEGLRLNLCKGVYILTDNEWLNIKLYYELRHTLDEQEKNIRIFTRVSSVDLMNHLNQEKAKPKSVLRPGDSFFNIHAAAGRQLFDADNVNDSLREEFNTFLNWKLAGIESVVFFGFGRFSSEFLNQLQSDNVIRKTLRSIIIVDPRAEESWKHFTFDYPFSLKIIPKIVKAGMENIAILENTFSEMDLGHSLAVFGSDNDIGNIKYATAFHKIYDKKDALHYILRTKSRINFSREVLDIFLGRNYILVPTYDWIKAYFEDEFEVTGKSQGTSLSQ
jgi:hypothetical protein